MAWSFNPFTGNLDLTGSSGAVVFEGEVETFDDLPAAVGDPAVGASFLVRSSTGVWLVNRRQAGIWIRKNNTGVRATDWEYGGDYPVNSVNGQTGNVSLTASDVGAVPTSRTISAGTGLTGGGDLTANRTLTVSYGTTSGTACEGNDARLSNARTPSSHASTHHTGGTDAIAPNNISAAWAEVVSSQTLLGNTTLSSGRNRRITITAFGSLTITLPTTSENGDLLTLVAGTLGGGTVTIQNSLAIGLATMTTFGQSYTFISSGSGTWTLRNVNTHTHAASEITSGVLDNARINFAAPSAIGSTTPSSVSATDLSASNRLNIPSTNGTTAGDLYRNANTLRYRDGTNTERLLLNATDNLANLASASTARTNLGVGSSDAVTFGSIQNTPIGSTTAAAITGTTGTFSTLSANNGTLTASAPVLDLSQTWNNAAVTFTAFRINATNTNSSALSLLADFQVGGTTQFSVRRDGVVACVNRINVTSALNGLEVSQASNGASPVRYTVDSAGTGNGQIRPTGNVMEQIGTTTTSGQTFRLYNTFTDASNYERGFMRWNASVLELGTEALGTGSSRNVAFFRGGARQFTLIGSGALQLESTGQLSWASRGAILMSADGVMWLSNNAGTSFGRLIFGGTTSSFPALKRSSTALQVRLGDDSGFATIDGQLQMEGTAPATSGATGTAGDIRYDADYIYVCTAANTWKRAAIATW